MDFTPTLNLHKPAINGEDTENVWGYDLNTNFDLIDAAFASLSGDKGDIIVGSNGSLTFDPNIVTAAARTVIAGTTIPIMRATLGAEATIPGGTTAQFWRGDKSWQTLAIADVPALQPALDLKAPLASPAFTGNPTAPTPAPGDNDTSIATTAFVANGLAAKAPLASPVFTGNPTAPTPAPGDNDTSIATTAYVVDGLTTGLAAKAPLASPAFTGNPTAPTPIPGDNDTSIATTAFVTAAMVAINAGPIPSNADPAMDNIAAAGTSVLYARGDHVHPADTKKVNKAGDTMTGPLGVTGSGTFGSTLAVRTTPTAYIFADGGSSGTTGGSAIAAQISGANTVAIGNKSAIFGGAYDAAPMIWGNATIYCNVGITTPGTFTAAAFNATGARSLFSAVSEPFSIGVRYNSGTPLVYLGASAAGGFQMSSAGGVPMATILSTGETTLLGNLSIPADAAAVAVYIRGRAPDNAGIINFNNNAGGQQGQIWSDAVNGGRMLLTTGASLTRLSLDSTGANFYGMPISGVTNFTASGNIQGAIFAGTGGRSAFIAVSEPFSICLKYSSGSNGIYIGERAVGGFQLSNNGGASLFSVDTAGTGVFSGGLNTSGNITVNGGGVIAGTSASSGTFYWGTNAATYITMSANTFTASTDFNIKQNGVGTSNGLKLIRGDNNNYNSILTGGDNNLYLAFNSGAAYGMFNSTSGAYSTVSDLDSKKAVASLDTQWEAVKALNPISYLMKEQDDDVRRNLGFVAQEVRSIIPQAWTKMPKEMGDHEGLEMTAFIPVLTKALQEVMSRLELAEARVAQLEAA